MEQMKGKAVLQSDFYALGGTMIFLLTAENPGHFYDFTTDKLIWRDRVADLSPQFADLIDYMMAFSPLQRPKSSQEIFHKVVAIDPSLKLLAEDFHSPSIARQSTLLSSASSIAATVFTNNPDTPVSNSQITPEFVERCRQELAAFIGPMANVVCKRTFKQNPDISQQEFCAILAKTIAVPAQARDFLQRLI